MDFRYYQKDGRIGLTYKLSLEELTKILDDHLIKPFSSENSQLPEDPWHGEIDMGFVPMEVQEKGKAHICEYAKRACRERHEENLVQARRDRDQTNERMRNVNRAISTQHKGMTLKGRIVSHESGGVLVSLEEPFESERGYIFKYPTCWAQAMSGKHVFDYATGELTSMVLEDSRLALVELYKAEVAKREHGEAVKLVETLNGLGD